MASYVYGVIDDSAQAPTGRGIGDAPVQLVSGAGAAALVSELPHESLEMGRGELLVHARVLEEALMQGTVLPMRFGMVLEGAEAIRRDLLEAHAEQLRSQLAELEGKVEVRVRAMYLEESLMREVVQENRDIAQIRRSLRGKPDDATYYARIELGERVAHAIDAKRQSDAEEILDKLAPLAAAVDVTEPSHERIVVNLSLLVDRARFSELDERVEQIAREQANRMRVKLTGPLPPHSFVQLAGAV